MKEFIKCLLRDDCQYSIKKILTYAFAVLVIYLVIFTEKDYYYLLMFMASLLGIRAFEKVRDPRFLAKPGNNGSPSPTPADDAPIPTPTPLPPSADTGI